MMPNMGNRVHTNSPNTLAVSSDVAVGLCAAQNHLGARAICMSGSPGDGGNLCSRGWIALCNRAIDMPSDDTGRTFKFTILRAQTVEATSPQIVHTLVR